MINLKKHTNFIQLFLFIYLLETKQTNNNYRERERERKRNNKKKINFFFQFPFCNINFAFKKHHASRIILLFCFFIITLFLYIFYKNDIKIVFREDYY